MGVKDLWLKFKSLFVKKLPEATGEIAQDDEILESKEATDAAKTYREEIAKQAEEMEQKHFEEILATGQEQEFFKEVLKRCGINPILINNPVSFRNIMEQIYSSSFRNNIYTYDENNEKILKENISYDDIKRFMDDIKNGCLNIEKDKVSFRINDCKTFGGTFSRRNFTYKANADGTVDLKRGEQYNNKENTLVRRTTQFSTFDKNGIETKRTFERREEEEMPYIGYSSRGGQVTNYYSEAKRDSEDITKVVLSKNDEKFLIDLTKTPYIGDSSSNDIATLNGVERYFTDDRINVEVFYTDMKVGSEVYEKKKELVQQLMEKSENTEGCKKYGKEEIDKEVVAR